MAGAARPLSTLLKRATIDDHEEVLQACNATLKQSKGDLDAQHIKVVALLKLDRHDDALRLFEESGDKLKNKAQLEHAYALYKAGELKQALKIALGLEENRGASHVQAQASYRMEDFPTAALIYKTLSSNTSQAAAANEENDLRINVSATDAQLEWKRQGKHVQKKKPGREDLEAFETAYNAACGCIARGELGQGEVLLKRAKDLCASSEDLTDQDKASELLPIVVQQLYIFSALGKTEEAETLAAELVLNEIPDLSTRQVAQINKLAVSSQPANPYLSHRLFHSTSTLLKTDQLFEFQQALVKQNELALDLLASKFTGVKNSTARFLGNSNSPTTSAAVNGISTANAAAHAQNKLGKFGLKDILPLLEKRPNDVGLILTIVHLYMLTKNHGAAITVMEAFFKRVESSTTTSDQDVRFSPGLVAILVSLYTMEGRKSHIKKELAKAASYWRHKSKGSRGLLHAAGVSLLNSPKSQDLEAAGDIFKTLLEMDPKDQLAVAGFVAAYATSGPAEFKTELNRLPQVNRLTVGIDVNALENAGVPQIISTSSILNKKRAGENNIKRAKKRARKSRLPKDYDPSKVPDIERWLPLRDRSTYKPKSKKGKQKVAGLTQGGVSDKVADGLNASSEGTPKLASTVVSSSSSKQKKKKPKK